MRIACLVIVTAVGCSGSSATHDAPAADTAQIDAATETYAAFVIPGGLDRIRIVKTVGVTCFAIQLVSPMTAAGGVTLPSTWAVERATAMEPAGACNPNYVGQVPAQFGSMTQSGAIMWQGNPPHTIDSVQVTFMFVNPPAWCPASAMLAATSLTVM